MNKYKDAINKFDFSLNEEKIRERVNCLLKNHFDENNNQQTLRKLHGLIDLTMLKTTDTKDRVWELVEKKINDYEGTHPDVDNVAAVCVYPLFIDTVKQSLTAKDVRIASVVGGFPSSQTFTEIKIAETAMAVMQGAQEIDVVMNIGLFLEEEYEKLTDELSEIKESSRGSTMKVILETGALSTVDNIRKASILALYSGADFIKTSTGKGYSGATFESVYTMCCVLKEYVSITGRKAGIKVAGGIKTTEDAIKYYTIVKELLGVDWLSKDFFRIGTSSLLDSLEQKIN